MKVISPDRKEALLKLEAQVEISRKIALYYADSYSVATVGEASMRLLFLMEEVSWLKNAEGELQKIQKWFPRTIFPSSKHRGHSWAQLKNLEEALRVYTERFENNA